MSLSTTFTHLLNISSNEDSTIALAACSNAWSHFPGFDKSYQYFSFLSY